LNFYGEIKSLQELKEVQTVIEKSCQRIQNIRLMRLDDEFTPEELKQIKTGSSHYSNNYENMLIVRVGPFFLLGLVVLDLTQSIIL
jgi:hypothetical protein